jgi:hypothetical protein
MKSTPERTQHTMIYAVLAAALLSAYGLLRFPSVVGDPRGVAGIVLVLGVYAALGWRLPPALQRRSPAVLRAGSIGGFLAGGVFLVEMALEYILLPADNSSYGLVEYGLVLALCFAAGLGAARQRGSWLDGLLAALWCAVIASLIFLLGLYIFFYLFNGTPRQMQVLAAEGSLEDFARSGMIDLNTFLMGDMLGAGCYHSLLLPLAGSILGAAGALIGKLLAPRPRQEIPASPNQALR